MAVREVAGIDGTSLVYRVFGSETAPVLVLLHGWAQSSRCWGDGVLDALARDFRVVAVDLRGHGYSQAPETGYADRSLWAGDLAAVLAAENVSETNPAVLLGWSYGGLVICDYLAEHGAGAVAGLVLVGAITSIGRGEKGGRVGARCVPRSPPRCRRTRRHVRALGSFGNALTGPVVEGSALLEGKGAVSQALFGASCPPRRTSVRRCSTGRWATTTCSPAWTCRFSSCTATPTRSSTSPRRTTRRRCCDAPRPRSGRVSTTVRSSRIPTGSCRRSESSLGPRPRRRRHAKIGSRAVWRGDVPAQPPAPRGRDLGPHLAAGAAGTGDAGGMNVYVLQTAVELARRGVEVEIFTRATSSADPAVQQAAPGVLVRNIEPVRSKDSTNTTCRRSCVPSPPACCARRHGTRRATTTWCTRTTGCRGRSAGSPATAGACRSCTPPTRSPR